MNRYDKLLVLLVILLSVLGLINFFSASYFSSLKSFGSPYYYFLRFLAKVTFLGFLFFVVGNILSRKLKVYRKLIFFVFVLIYLSIFLGFLPQFKLPGNPTARWVNLGFISFQPSELIKPFAILFLIFLLLHFKKLSLFQRTLIFICFLLLVLLPIYFQPSFSNTMIIFASLSITFFSTLRSTKEIFASGLILFLIFLIFVATSTLWSYRLERILSFLTKGELYGEKYFQLEISQIGISSGGLLGKGLGKSETKIVGIPQLLTDSIFVVYAEELGFVGCLVLIFLYLFLILKIILKGIRSDDEIQKSFSLGVATWLFLQIFLHLASNIGLIAPTGVILPFFSYGASGQLAIYFSLGIISKNG